jgi:hypothetical protein
MLWSSASIAYSGEPDGRRHQLEVVRTGKWANGRNPEPAGRLERQKATHRRHRNSSFRHPSGSRICRSERPLQRDAQLRLEGFRDNLCELDAPEHKFRTFLRFSPSRSTSPMIFSLCPLPYMVAVSQTVHPCVVLPSVSYGSDPLAGRSRTRRPSLTAQSRSPCAKSPCSLRRSACRTRSSSLRQRSRSAPLRQRGGESVALERDKEQTHRAEAGQRQLSTISEASCLWHASGKSGSRG